MFLQSTVAALFAAAFAAAAVVPNAAAAAATAIQDAKVATSMNGSATCITGHILISISFDSANWKLKIPATQLELTDLATALTTWTPDQMAALASGKIHFDKTYRIFVKYCVPSAPYSNDTARSIQVLTHGAALDHSYWDFGPGYSYQHAAAAAGLATISYDRLGIGKSDIPDPLFEVNSMSTLEILHGLNSVVRSGGLGRHYNKIIGVGHSLGSAVTQTIPAKFPLDFDAIILTGFVSTPPPTITAGALGFLKANDNPRLGHLPDGYILPGVPTGVHLSFFKYPNFDPAILEESVNRMQTQALGELLAAPGIIDEVDLSSLKNYSSPVLIVNGENDFSACGFSCVTPRDMTKDTLKDGWPAADPILSDTMVHAGLGHNLNTHLSAEAVYNGMIGWVQKVESS